MTAYLRIRKRVRKKRYYILFDKADSIYKYSGYRNDGHHDTTPNYLLFGDVEADDWMDDMIQMLEKVKRPEHRELAKKQIALLRLEIISQSNKRAYLILIFG